MNVNSNETIVYEFENVFEFMYYCGTIKENIGDASVLWSQGADYAYYFKEACKLFDKRQHEKAIEMLNTALRFNPVGLNARFELSQNYIAINELDKARRTLLEMKDYLYNDSLIAKFYRTLGYIYIEKNYIRLHMLA